MAKQVPFINREDVLRKIDRFVREIEVRQVIFVGAEGGIGKTRLLQQVRYIYTNTKSIFITDIIDFDDQAFHIPLNIERKIAHMLGENHFQPYLQALWDWRKMEASGLSTQRLATERAKIREIFTQCFNMFSSKKRVVLLFDTTDAIQQTEVWNYLKELIHLLNNTVLVLAGRNAAKLSEILVEELREVELIPLAPLEDQYAESYLKNKQDLLHIHEIPIDLVKKITFLAQGKPILMDLAIEWIARDIPLEWIEKSSLKDLKTLSPSNREKHQIDFERQLVKRIINTRSQIDLLTLYMSHVHPIDKNLIAKLLRTSESNANELFQEAKTLAFVKLLPDGRISLHDEVRRMINKYAWPEVDPDRGRRHWLSNLVASYLGKRIARLRHEITSLHTEESTQDLKSFIERESLERQLWVLEEQRLRHTLFFNVNKGIQLFSKLFDEATKIYRSQVRGTLLSEIRKYEDGLTAEKSYILAIRRANYLFDFNEYTKVKEIISDVLERYTLEPLQKVELLRLLGNTEIRLDNLSEGLRSFEEANNITPNIADHNQRLMKQVEVQNALGWGYRLRGQIEQAIEQYEMALGNATELLGEEGLIASILNNLGYANYLRGHKETGLSLCQQAKEIVPSSDTQQIGFINSTLGEICLGLGRYREASHYYETALTSFCEISSNEGQAIVHMEISHSNRHLASMEIIDSQIEKEDLLKSALDHARASVQICEQYDLYKEMPLCYYELGRVLIDLELYEKAEFYLQKSYPKNLRREGGFALADLTALTEIAYRQKDYKKVEKWVMETQKPDKAKYLLKTERLDSILFYGRLLRFWAESQIKKGDYDEALTTYIEALSNIAIHGGYGAYRLDRELDRLKKNINLIPAAKKVSWCDRFVKIWQTDSDRNKYTQVIAAVRLAKMM